jgi:hypothetical protein
MKILGELHVRISETISAPAPGDLGKTEYDPERGTHRYHGGGRRWHSFSARLECALFRFFE